MDEFQCKKCKLKEVVPSPNDPGYLSCRVCGAVHHICSNCKKIALVDCNCRCFARLHKFHGPHTM
jgi:hypothetical protein